MAGHNTIKMTDLEKLVIDEGFNDVETYIQSGNIIFTSNEGLHEDIVAGRLESAISLRLGSEIAVMVRTDDIIRKIILENPYLTESNFDRTKSAVIFLNEKPPAEMHAKMKEISYPPDRFDIKGKEIYIYCPNGFGRTKLYTNFFEKKMKVKGTARNWNTITAIHKITETRKSSGKGTVRVLPD